MENQRTLPLEDISPAEFSGPRDENLPPAGHVFSQTQDRGPGHSLIALGEEEVLDEFEKRSTA